MASYRDQAGLRPALAEDGKRILVRRLWPRGLRKDTASLDLWSKDIAPTSSLRMWFDSSRRSLRRVQATLSRRT